MRIYRLTRHAFGEHPSFDLTHQEYEAICAAQRHVTRGTALEDLFYRMLGNYEEFERELLVIALREATYYDAHDDWNLSVDTIQLIARRLDNLLTTIHAYYHQTLHAISGLYGGTESPH
jgi:hypothetical protein